MPPRQAVSTPWELISLGAAQGGLPGTQLVPEKEQGLGTGVLGRMSQACRVPCGHSTGSRSTRPGTARAHSRAGGTEGPQVKPRRLLRRPAEVAWKAAAQGGETPRDRSPDQHQLGSHCARVPASQPAPTCELSLLLWSGDGAGTQAVQDVLNQKGHLYITLCKRRKNFCQLNSVFLYHKASPEQRKFRGRGK